MKRRERGEREEGEEKERRVREGIRHKKERGRVREGMRGRGGQEKGGGEKHTTLREDHPRMRIIRVLRAMAATRNLGIVDHFPRKIQPARIYRKGSGVEKGDVRGARCLFVAGLELVISQEDFYRIAGLLKRGECKKRERGREGGRLGEG